MLKKSAVLACLCLTACMVGPDYKEPKTNVAKHWAKQDTSINDEEFKQSPSCCLILTLYHNKSSVQVDR